MDVLAAEIQAVAAAGAGLAASAVAEAVAAATEEEAGGREEVRAVLCKRPGSLAY